MDVVSKDDLDVAVSNVLKRLTGISQLYPSQYQLLCRLVEKENIFFTSPTNSGKTLVAVILPDVVSELAVLGYEFPKNPKILFITPLNSIKLSMVSSMNNLGVECKAVSKENIEETLSSGVSVLFISPEVLKMDSVVKVLLRFRSNFILKVIDEVRDRA